MGETVDFILVIPAKDASAVEKRLRRAYTKHSKKSEWFTLNDSERREILIIAALVKVTASDDLGMSAVDQEIVQVATDLLNQFQAWAKVLWSKKKRTPQQGDEEDGTSEHDPQPDDFSVIPEFDWNWESVLKKDYRALSKLKRKEAYVSFVRDNSERQGKVFFDSHPVTSIEAAFLERSLSFSLEIALVLKVDNKKKARTIFLSPNERKNATEWVNLSDDELGEIKKVASEDWKHGSVYVSPKSHWGLETLSPDDFREYPRLEDTAGYVCVVQGVEPGTLRKIWMNRHPKRLAGDKRLALRLNSPHDAYTSCEPIRFISIIKSEHAESFQDFLHQRYRAFRKSQGWFELDDAQLEETCKMGR